MKSRRPDGSWKTDQPTSECTPSSPRTSRNNDTVASKFPVRVPRKQIRVTFMALFHTGARASPVLAQRSRTLAQTTSAAGGCRRVLLAGLFGHDLTELRCVDELPEVLELAVTHIPDVHRRDI